MTHRDVGKLLVGSRDVVLGSDTFDFRRRVDSREEDEEHWDPVIGLSEGFEDAEWWLFDVSFAHHFAYERGECGCHSVGPHGSIEE